MVILKRYSSREHTANSEKRCYYKIRKTNRLKALCMMQNKIWNKQAMCQQPKAKHKNKKNLKKSMMKNKHHINKQH